VVMLHLMFSKDRPAMLGGHTQNTYPKTQLQ
jgi:hypothetical protein